MDKYYATFHELFSYLITQTTWIFLYNYLNIWIWIPVQALLGLKSFIIFHDCGHNSFSPSKTFNRIIYNIMSVICWTPTYWSDNHRLHHASSGNLECKTYNWNDTFVLTKKEYQNLSLTKRLAYRIFRFPLVFFTLSPILIWFIKYRIPIKMTKHSDVFQKIINTICVVGLLIFLYKLFGIEFVKHYVMAVYGGGVLGIMLFHTQHIFNPSYVQRESWKFSEAALKGSSYIDIPFIFKWFTMGIQFHHVHHLNPLIPGYNLEKYHQNTYAYIKPLTAGQIWESLWCTLYDEDIQKFV